MPRAALALICLAVLGAAAPGRARAEGLSTIVRAVCPSAFENELTQSGKVAPPGMAAYACSCVEQRILAGGGIESARSVCRQATAQRFPI